MPEFILDRGSIESTRAFNGLDEFTQGYIEAAFFTSTGPDNEHEGLGAASFDEIESYALAKVMTDCSNFQDQNARLLDQAYGKQGKYEREAYDARRAGMDYWYTRNGHGTGFWDRGLGELGDQLANAARYHEINMARGDDGLIYFE